MGIEVIIGAIATLAPLIYKIITDIQSNKANIKLTEFERLMAVANAAVATAEQMRKTHAWTGEMARDHAVRAITLGFPQLDKETVKQTVEAAVAIFNQASAK
jgi:hypothetical protein